MEKSKHDQVELAGIGPRLIAAFIDYVLVSVGSSILGNMLAVFGAEGTFAALFFGIALFIASVGYSTVMWVQADGQTVGKMFVGVRVVKRDGSPITVVDALKRYGGYMVNNLLFGLGWFYPLLDANRQGIQDKLAGTLVVKGPKRLKWFSSQID